MTANSPLTPSFSLHLVAIALLALLAGCSSAPPVDTKAMVEEWAAFMQRDHVIRPGDRIAVTVYQADDLTQEIVVSPSGTVNLRRLPDSIRAVGMTMAAFRRHVQQAYSEVLQLAEVSVSLVEASVNSVYVTGEVKRPGPVDYATGMTLSQAIAGAGGFDITAKTSDVRVLRNVPQQPPRTFRVNLNDILFEQGTDFLMLPGDVVFCQTTGIADANNFVELYIRRMLPFPSSATTFLAY